MHSPWSELYINGWGTTTENCVLTTVKINACDQTEQRFCIFMDLSLAIHLSAVLSLEQTTSVCQWNKTKMIMNYLSSITQYIPLFTIYLAVNGLAYHHLLCVEFASIRQNKEVRQTCEGSDERVLMGGRVSKRVPPRESKSASHSKQGCDIFSGKIITWFDTKCKAVF